MSRVSLHRVCKRFDEVTAVDSLDLEIAHGEFMVLVGPSGCGKTTTLRMIAGLESATSGELMIGDRVVNEVAPRDRDIAFVFQNYALYPHMSVFENMAFGLRLRRIERAEIDRKVQAAASLLGIGELLERKPRALSGGQRQRVAMGRAIVRDPQVFLFDEPLSNLDAKLRVQMRLELARLHKRLGATMIYVTHDQVEAMTLADRIAIMDGGRLQQVGSPLEVFHAPHNRFVAGFIGSPTMNFIPVALEAQGERNTVAAGDFRLSLEGLREGEASADLTLGVRPQHLALAPQPAAHTLSGVVEVIEHLGAEKIVHVKTDAAELMVQVPSEQAVQREGVVHLAVDSNKVHVFDHAGLNLRAAFHQRELAKGAS